ncbi:Uncharacterized protein APZ42_031990 [Daphnia magna]|uniref:Uncharacterized protein n=1 Tax=Daphnia magna TaxID=35525 RepID=A0A164MGT2_9CRUS|nr:Uncharacterized protein APZ42_031990 [Daphnia magna]
MVVSYNRLLLLITMAKNNNKSKRAHKKRSRPTKRKVYHQLTKPLTAMPLRKERRTIDLSYVLFFTMTAHFGPSLFNFMDRRNLVNAKMSQLDIYEFLKLMIAERKNDSCFFSVSEPSDLYNLEMSMTGRQSVIHGYFDEISKHWITYLMAWIEVLKMVDDRTAAEKMHDEISWSSATRSSTGKRRPDGSSAPGHVAIRTAQRWDNTTKVTVTTNIKPLPGTKKTLEDFVRKPFKAAPVPASTYKAPADHLAPKTKPQTKIVKKAIAKEVTEIKKVLPFRANPVPASTYKPHIALFTAGRSANNGKLKGANIAQMASPENKNTPVVVFDVQPLDDVTVCDATNPAEASMAAETTRLDTLDEPDMSQQETSVAINPDEVFDDVSDVDTTPEITPNVTVSSPKDSVVQDDPLATTSPSVINSELAGAATVDIEDTLTENTSVVTCDEQATDGITFADASDTSEKSMAAEEASIKSLVEDEAVVSQENLPVAIIPEAGLDEAIVQDESLAIACDKPCLSSPVLAEVSDVIQQEPAFAPVVTDALANEVPVKKGKKQRSQNDNASPKKKLPKRAKGSKASAKPCVRDDFIKQEPSVASVVPIPDGKDAPVERDKKHKPHYGNAWYQKKMEKRLNERTQRAALKETAQSVETPTVQESAH